MEVIANGFITSKNALTKQDHAETTVLRHQHFMLVFHLKQESIYTYRLPL